MRETRLSTMNMKFSPTNKCQTCLIENDDNNTIESLSLITDMDTLLNFLDIQIIKGLPNTMCNECVTKLKNMLTFKHQCLVSISVLKKLHTEQSFEINNVAQVTSHIDNTVKLEEQVKTEDEQEEILSLNDIFNHSDSENSTSQPIVEEKPTTRKSLKRDKRNDDEMVCAKRKENLQAGNMSCLKPRCRFICNTKEELVEHSQNKHDTVCNVCKRQFYNHKSLKRHKLVHETVREKFYCEICKKFYDSKATYYVHMKKFHSNDQREKTVCTHCGISVYDIKQHMKFRHSESKEKYTCTFCGKVFKTDTTLKTHTKVHHEHPDKFKSLCPECGKVFRTANEVKYHLVRMHSGPNVNVRKYACRHCDKSFKTSGHRGNHEKVVHFNDRRYKCEICFKSFSTRSILNNHVRTHTGEKPFICDICRRPFAQKVTLRTHLKLVHGTEIHNFYLRTKPVNVNNDKQIINEQQSKLLIKTEEEQLKT